MREKILLRPLISVTWHVVVLPLYHHHPTPDASHTAQTASNVSRYRLRGPVLRCINTFYRLIERNSEDRRQIEAQIKSTHSPRKLAEERRERRRRCTHAQNERCAALRTSQPSRRLRQLPEKHHVDRGTHGCRPRAPVRASARNVRRARINQGTQGVYMMGESDDFSSLSPVIDNIRSLAESIRIRRRADRFPATKQYIM